MSREDFRRALLMMFIILLWVSILVSAIEHAHVPAPDTSWADRSVTFVWVKKK